jgi:hypothetical protein
MEMKTFNQFVKPTAILVGLLITLPMSALADKGDKPHNHSGATTAACLDDVDEGEVSSVHVYSCKALSNVVLWCGTTYVKHDDIVGDSDEEIFDGVYDCGTNAAGVPILGSISMVAIKSGGQKNTDIEGAPPGSGLFLDGLLSCDHEDFQSPLPGECDADISEALPE